mgnify:CR=1 FL=1
MKKILSAIAIVLSLVCVLASCNIQLTPNESATPTIEISEDGYWVINGTKTEYKAVYDEYEENPFDQVLFLFHP